MKCVCKLRYICYNIEGGSETVGSWNRQPRMATAICNNINIFGCGPKKVHGNKNKISSRLCFGVVSSDTQRRLLNFHCHVQPFFGHGSRGVLETKRQDNYCCVSTSRTGDAETDPQLQNEGDVSKATLIWRAIKLPIYSVALVPLTVGGSAAYLQIGLFSVQRYFLLLASSVLVITWLNLSNDVYDYDTGADKNKKESVINMVGSRSGTFMAAYFLLALGFTGLMWTSFVAGNMRAILLLTSAIICGYIYQCPPFRLSYLGLGEPLCFAAFGPFATTGFYLLLGSTSEMTSIPVSGMIVLASFLVGFTTTLILFCSHFHQVEGDKAVGKFSPLVRIGTERGSGVVKAAMVTLYSLLFAVGLSKALPISCVILCALTIPMAKSVVNYVEDNHTDKVKIFMAKYYCVRLHALFGAALAAGLVVARLVKVCKPELMFP